MRHREHTPWVEIARIAGEQWNQITYRQLRAAGLSPGQIRSARDNGRLFSPFTGVLSVGRPPSHPRERAMAAVLACGPRALLSHEWALWNFGLRKHPPDHPPDVSAPPSIHDRDGITVHRTRHLTPDHDHGIPSTRPERAIVDAAPSLPQFVLRRVINDAQIKGLATAEAIREAARGRSRAVLRELPVDQRGATKSLLEDLLLELDLPRREINAVVHGKEWDNYFPDLDLILEADGFETHSTRHGFEDDHECRLRAEAAGTRVVAVTYRQVTKDRALTAERLLRIAASQP